MNPWAMNRRTSNNKEYRISQVFGFIDPSGSKDVTITRTAGAPKEDKLVIHFGPAPADATDAQAAFGAVTPAGTVTIPVSATEEKAKNIKKKKINKRKVRYTEDEDTILYEFVYRQIQKGIHMNRLHLHSKNTWGKVHKYAKINRDGQSMCDRWRKHLQSLARLNELDDLQEKIKACLRKAFKDENDSEIDDSSSVSRSSVSRSSVSRSSVSRSSEVKAASIKVSLEVTVKPVTSGTPQFKSSQEHIPRLDAERVTSGTPQFKSSQEHIPRLDAERVTSGTPQFKSSQEHMPRLDAERVTSGTPQFKSSQKHIPRMDAER
ncbi:hypothetical protein CAEBREN_11873 [Caenorhabditis brenneri]|uniref:Major sperm protein n=1 Tax=Caenorhabditis brenneri TaxID=135651 RepID=G0P5K7_CAEBE|nr:hypothetical protein CAEBREN_11873 [Caenorhabditis brenneri]